MDMVEGESIMALVQLGMGNGRTVHNGLVVSMHVVFLMNWNIKVVKS